MLLAPMASSQQLPDMLVQQAESLGEGWRGFSDLAFLAKALGMLLLAAILATAIAFHPNHRRLVKGRDDIANPSVFVTYAVIGALVGIIVGKYGLLAGFVFFGIGGLIRFRTIMRSARLTGQLIYVTLIGLSCGLDLPHVAVLATAFGFVLLSIFDTRIVYRIDVRGLPVEQFVAAATAYRDELERNGCEILNEKKRPRSKRATYIFRPPHSLARDQLEQLLEEAIDSPLRGSVDWEIN
ncbi:MAG: hypothetical protein KJO95_09000 [Gammaproteobacteria bacterium]|nr:hypothetical protein [Gammaproteobacteria bacterium]